MYKDFHMSALKRFGAVALVGVIFVSLLATGIKASGTAGSASSTSAITGTTLEIMNQRRR